MSLHTARAEDGRGYVLVEPSIVPHEGFGDDVAYYAADAAQLARAKGGRTITDREFAVIPVVTVINRTRIGIEFTDEKPITPADLDEFAKAVARVIGVNGTPVEVIPYAKIEAV